MRTSRYLALGGSALLALAVSACTEKKAETSPSTTTVAVAQASRALEVPRDRVWAGSAHLRVVDVAAGQVVAGIDLQKAIEDIVFSADGRRAYVATSEGVRVADVESVKIASQLTTSPARQVLLAPDGKSVGVLEHDVTIADNGARTPSAFRWKTLDVDTGRVLSEETVGQRVLGVVPGYGARASVIMFESGEIGLIAPGRPLTSEPKTVDLSQGVPSTAKSFLTPRPYFAIAADGRKAWLPVEGLPSRVLEVDLERGTTRAIPLGEGLSLRGLAVTPDGARLVVNASKKLLLVDLATSAVLGQVDLGGAHIGAVVSEDGRRAYLAQTIHEKGGALTVVALDPVRLQGKIHLDDISPWVLGLAPRAAVAAR